MWWKTKVVMIVNRIVEVLLFQTYLTYNNNLYKRCKGGESKNTTGKDWKIMKDNIITQIVLLVSVCYLEENPYNKSYYHYDRFKLSLWFCNLDCDTDFIMIGILYETILLQQQQQQQQQHKEQSMWHRGYLVLTKRCVVGSIPTAGSPVVNTTL